MEALEALRNPWLATAVDAHTATDFGTCRDNYIQAERSVTESTIFSYSSVPSPSAFAVSRKRNTYAQWQQNAASTEELRESWEDQYTHPALSQRQQHPSAFAPPQLKLMSGTGSTEELRAILEDESPHHAPSPQRHEDFAADGMQPTPKFADWLGSASTEVLRDRLYSDALSESASVVSANHLLTFQPPQQVFHPVDGNQKYLPSPPSPDALRVSGPSQQTHFQREQYHTPNV